MDFSADRRTELPRLAWCARIAPDGVTAMVGDGVEIGPTHLVEGAWAGDFQGDFTRSVFLAGSGLRVDDDRVVVSAPSHIGERLFVDAKPGRVVVSNSLSMLLASIGDRVSIDHAEYYFDFIDAQREGLGKVRMLPTDGGRVSFHDASNLEVTSDLSIERTWPPTAPHLGTYAEFAGYVGDTTAELFDNAVDSRRVHSTYRPLMSLSRGYDSTAVAAVAAGVGAREALTFSDDPLDDGRVVGDALGFQTAAFSRRDYLELDLPELEFCAVPLGASVTLSATEDLVRDSVLLTGVRGDSFWSGRRSHVYAGFASPGARNLAVTSQEFRLRVGFVYLPLPYLVGHRVEDLHRISNSPEMQPWSIGGDYDRPIARRLAEEAGVPREAFGQAKAGTGHVHLDKAPMSDEGASFEDFLRNHRASVGRFVRRRSDRTGRLLHRANRKISEAVGRTPIAWHDGLLPLATMPTRKAHRLWGTRWPFLFHWGMAGLEDRYASVRSEFA